MDRETTIEWLKGYKIMSMRINRLNADAEELKGTFGNAGQYYGRGYRNSDLYKSLKSQFKEIEEKKRAAVIHQRRVRASIESVPDEDLRQLLVMRYIEGMEWEKIANAMYLSVDHVRGGKHRKALDYVQIPSRKSVKQS